MMENDDKIYIVPIQNNKPIKFICHDLQCPIAYQFGLDLRCKHAITNHTETEFVIECDDMKNCKHFNLYG